MKDINPNSGNYTRINWLDERGEPMFTISSHEWTNPKMEGAESVIFRHSHTTFYTRSDSGSMVHALDITHSEEQNQIKASLPVVFDDRVIMRSDGGYYELKIKGGSLVAERISSDEVIRANKDRTVLGGDDG